MCIKINVSHHGSMQYLCFEKSLFQRSFHLYLIVDGSISYRVQRLYSRQYVASAIRAARESGMEVLL